MRRRLLDRNVYRRLAGRSLHRAAVRLGAVCVPANDARSRLADLTSAGTVTMGRECFGQPDIQQYAGDHGKIRIGSYVSFATGVEIFLGGEHRTDWVSTYAFRAVQHMPGAYSDGHPATKGDVVIGSDVWIAKDAKILSGVRIGNGAVVGASAVVASDVRPYAIAVGNPAREIRRRFSDIQCEALERIAWWEWAAPLIVQRVDWLSCPNVDEFILQFAGTP